MKVIVISGSEKLEANFGVSSNYEFEKMCDWISDFCVEDSVLCVYNLGRSDD